MKIALVALGKIGLPLAVQFAMKGHQVIGCDVNQKTVDNLKKAGATVFVNDPMYTEEEISALGFSSYQIGDAIDGVILQADHKEYKELTASNFPGLQALVDGRRYLNPSSFSTVKFLVIGSPANG